MTRPIHFVAPNTIAEASCFLVEDPSALVVSGGTALGILLKTGFAQPSLLVGLQAIPDIDAVTVEDCLRVGAMVSLRDLERALSTRPEWGVVTETLGKVASPRIRSMATVGGCLAHADPNLDLPVTLAALGAVVRAESHNSARSIPADEFQIDYYETVLAPGELVVGVDLAPLLAGEGAAFVKFVPRSADDYATVSAAAKVVVDPDGSYAGGRLALGGVGATPVTLDVTGVIRGRSVDASIASAVSSLVEQSVDPVDDVRGSANYKREMAVVFAARALRLAGERARATRSIGHHGAAQ